MDFASKFTDSKDILWRIGKADLIVFQLQQSDLVKWMIDICRKNGIKVVMDMDDDLLDVPEWNPSYFGLGRKFKDYLQLIDGQTMNVKENKKRLDNIAYMLRNVDLVTVTGRGLRNRYSKYNKVKILPNCVDEERIRTSRRSGGLFDNKIRIFWQGSSTHIYDLLLIREAVQEITEKYPQVQWFIWGGDTYKFFAEYMVIPEKRVEQKGIVDMEDYYDHLARVKMDIGICPLVDIPYNKCKSNIKWLEYSLSGIPAVVSDISTYTDSVRHGETGYIAKNTEDWVRYLSLLIENNVLREAIANQAKGQVLRDFNIKSKIEMWEDTYLRLINNG